VSVVAGASPDDTSEAFRALAKMRKLRSKMRFSNCTTMFVELHENCIPRKLVVNVEYVYLRCTEYTLRCNNLYDCDLSFTAEDPARAFLVNIHP